MKPNNTHVPSQKKPSAPADLRRWLIIGLFAFGFLVAVAILQGSSAPPVLPPVADTEIATPEAERPETPEPSRSLLEDWPSDEPGRPGAVADTAPLEQGSLSEESTPEPEHAPARPRAAVVRQKIAETSPTAVSPSPVSAPEETSSPAPPKTARKAVQAGGKQLLHKEMPVSSAAASSIPPTPHEQKPKTQNPLSKPEPDASHAGKSMTRGGLPLQLNPPPVPKRQTKGIALQQPQPAATGMFMPREKNSSVRAVSAEVSDHHSETVVSGAQRVLDSHGIPLRDDLMPGKPALEKNGPDTPLWKRP